MKKIDSITTMFISTAIFLALIIIGALVWRPVINTGFIALVLIESFIVYEAIKNVRKDLRD
jgi:hypothetical protein